MMSRVYHSTCCSKMTHDSLIIIIFLSSLASLWNESKFKAR